jgi:SAM-dependent methyltransferase
MKNPSNGERSNFTKIQYEKELDMSTKKQKKRNSRKRQNNKNKSFNTTNPKVFFRQIGIKPLVKQGEEGTRAHLERAVVKRCGQNAIKQIAKFHDNCDGLEPFCYYHSDLKLVKIWYGADFNRICDIVLRLNEINIPANPTVLDIGGGPGHLAFWMANIWNASSVTVADINITAGPIWAKEINESRVNFVKSKFPELEEVGDRKYDVVVLSRILSAMDELNLPESISDINDNEVQRLLAELEKAGNRLKNLVKPQGQVIVIDSWSCDRVLLVGKAFEKAGLYINLKKFIPERVGLEPSIITFSKSLENVPLKDLTYSLSIAAQFPPESPQYFGTVADSFRALFGNGEIKTEFEYESRGKGLNFYNLILEKEGLILVYRTDNQGRRAAWIFPGVYICDLMQKVEKLKNDLADDDWNINSVM